MEQYPYQAMPNNTATAVDVRTPVSYTHDVLSQASILADDICCMVADLIGPPPPEPCGSNESKPPEPLGLFNVLDEHARVTRDSIGRANAALSRLRGQFA